METSAITVSVSLNKLTWRSCHLRSHVTLLQPLHSHKPTWVNRFEVQVLLNAGSLKCIWQWNFCSH